MLQSHRDTATDDCLHCLGRHRFVSANEGWDLVRSPERRIQNQLYHHLGSGYKGQFLSASSSVRHSIRDIYTFIKGLISSLYLPTISLQLQLPTSNSNAMFITQSLISVTLVSLYLLIPSTTAISTQGKPKTDYGPTVCRNEWNRKSTASIDGVKKEKGTVKCVSAIVRRQ